MGKYPQSLFTQKIKNFGKCAFAKNSIIYEIKIVLIRQLDNVKHDKVSSTSSNVLSKRSPKSVTGRKILTKGKETPKETPLENSKLIATTPQEILLEDSKSISTPTQETSLEDSKPVAAKLGEEKQFEIKEIYHQLYQK